MNRRDFLMGAICAGAGAAGCRSLRMDGEQDENLSVFISDLHVGGKSKRLSYTGDRLEKAVDGILAMRPLPKRVVCFGDIALTFGLAADYAASKPALKRIEEAGIELHLTMGNHDRRSAFLECWPEYGERALVPERFTQVVSLGYADLVLLDTLKGADNRAETDAGPVGGTIDPAQLAWFEKFVAEAKRPFFVGSHQFNDLQISGERPIARAAKNALFAGWIYGHDHVWCPYLAVASWKDSVVCPTLALPSTGLWGDIGYVVFRTDVDGATAELVQSDFYIQTPTAHAVPPRFWATRARDNNGKTTRFAFENKA